jgi:hypothetical protein
MPTSAYTDGCSTSFKVGGGNVTLVLDDAAFHCEISDRITGRAQNLIRGVVQNLYYKTGGCFMDLTKLSKPGKFPLGRYRVTFQLDTTGTYYAVYDHVNKKIQVFSALGTEISDLTDIHTLVFPFLAVGE